MVPTPLSGNCLIIAHRGASHDAPENTLASLRRGWEQGADAGELDIHLSKDRQIVVIHDSSTRRTAGVDRPVSGQTLEELKKLDAGLWKDPQWKGERIPTLAEALEIVPPGKKLIIEIKAGPEILPTLQKVLHQTKQKPDQLVLIAFDYETICQAKKLLPEYEAYWLVAYKEDPSTGKYPEIAELIRKVRPGKLDGLDLHFSFPIDPAFMAQIKGAGLKLYIWTVDDPAIARKLRDVGVDGITTNRPRWLREQLPGVR